jgi:tetratricopeptide (TPR) repeat protein
MLFGDGAPASKAAAAAAATAGYKVRRRSGKIFGPFEERQIVEMLAKGELMGNEDVSSDGGGAWSPIGSVAAFGDALRKGAGAPPAAPPAPERQGVPFGDRMAGAKVVAGDGGGAGFPWKRLVVPAAAALVLLAAGVGAGFAGYGFFFVKAFRRADSAQVTALLGEARAALDRAEYPADRAALDAVARAVAADPDDAGAAWLHAAVVAALELGHGAPPEALDQARRAADRLESRQRGKLPALAARLAVTLATSPGAATLPHETALGQALEKASPDAEAVALLARAALARGDAQAAAPQLARLEAIRPGSPRAGHGAGLAALARRDVAAARAAFDKVLSTNPGHLATRLELAAVAEAAGDEAEAEAQLAWLSAPEAAAKLAPAEKARALALRGALLGRAAAKAAEADRALEAATQADPRSVEARLALARHRLRHADAAGAVTALEPFAQQAAAVPALAAVRIRALAAAGRALDASSLADQALARTPGDPALLLAKAAALEASGKAGEAAAQYAAAAARDPAAFEPRLALGRIALARGDLAAARVELAAAVEKGPREPSTHAGLGELASAEGDAAAADRAFQAALTLDPEHAGAQVGLARLAASRGDAAGARRWLERALALDPRNAEGHVALGTLLWKAKDLPAAEKAFQAAAELQPRNAVALARLGAVKLERREDLDGAVQRLSAASNEAPGLAEARQWLGRALLAKNEAPGAISQLRKAVELEPRNPEHHLHLGMALERSGALPEAIDAYRAATQADPGHAEAYERIALVYAGNGRNDEAASAYEKAIAAAPRVHRLRVALADCKARLGRHDEALKIYREVLKADPGAVQVPYKLARALHEAEGAKAALPWYERAARDEKDNPMPHYYLGYLYKERGQKAKAVAEFKRFLQLRPDADEKKDIEAEIEDMGG